MDKTNLLSTDVDLLKDGDGKQFLENFMKQNGLANDSQFLFAEELEHNGKREMRVTGSLNEGKPECIIGILDFLYANFPEIFVTYLLMQTEQEIKKADAKTEFQKNGKKMQS
jgi:hypothetical protein